jgi:hypothetical protein
MDERWFASGVWELLLHKMLLVPHGAFGLLSLAIDTFLQ